MGKASGTGGRAGKGSHNTLKVESAGYRELNQDEYQRMASQQNVTPEEEEELYNGGTTYIDSSWSRHMNKELVKRAIGDTLPDDFMDDKESLEAARLLDRVIDRNQAPANLRVVRRVNEQWLTEGGRQLKQGQTILEHRYTSTSAVNDRNYFKRRVVHMTIDIPKGHKCFITKNEDESEIILPRNTRFKITKLAEENGKTIIHLKAL